MAPPQPSIPIITTTANQGDRRTGLPFPPFPSALPFPHIFVRVRERVNILRPGSPWIERTPHTSPTALQDMGVDHRRADVFVSQQFLHRPNVVTVLQQMRGKAVAERISTLLIIRR